MVEIVLKLGDWNFICESFKPWGPWVISVMWETSEVKNIWPLNKQQISTFLRLLSSGFCGIYETKQVWDTIWNMMSVCLSDFYHLQVTATTIILPFWQRKKSRMLLMPKAKRRVGKQSGKKLCARLFLHFCAFTTSASNAASGIALLRTQKRKKALEKSENVRHELFSLPLPAGPRQMTQNSFRTICLKDPSILLPRGKRVTCVCISIWHETGY